MPQFRPTFTCVPIAFSLRFVTGDEMLLNGLLTLLNRLPAYRDLLAGAQAGMELPPQALVHAARPFVLAGLRAHLSDAGLQQQCHGLSGRLAAWL